MKTAEPRCPTGEQLEVYIKGTPVVNMYFRGPASDNPFYVNSAESAIAECGGPMQPKRRELPPSG